MLLIMPNVLLYTPPLGKVTFRPDIRTFIFTCKLNSETQKRSHSCFALQSNCSKLKPTFIYLFIYLETLIYLKTLIYLYTLKQLLCCFALINTEKTSVLFHSYPPQRMYLQEPGLPFVFKGGSQQTDTHPCIMLKCAEPA